MMNVVGLCLVLTSLVASGVWSPNPAPSANNYHHNPKKNGLVKEEHRVIVVEYDKVIQYQHDGRPNLKKQLSMFVNHGKPRVPDFPTYWRTQSTPADLLCHVLGVCTSKVFNMSGKAKDGLKRVRDAVAEKGHEINDCTKETFDEAKKCAEDSSQPVKEHAEESVNKAKGKVAQTAHDVKESARESWERAKESVEHNAHDARENAKEFLEEEKERATQKAHDIKESTKESLDRAKEIVANDMKERRKQLFDFGKGRDRGKETLAKAIRLDVAANATKAMIYIAKMIEDVARRCIDGGRFSGFLEVMSSLMVAVNLVGLAMAYGTCMWVTFISGYVLAMALPRQQLGVVQSRIYPVYFRVMGASMTAALLGHLLCLGKKWISSKAEILQGYNLLASLLMVLANAMFLEPRASKVMFERMRLEREEGIERERGVVEPPTQVETMQITDLGAQTTATRNTESTEEKREIRLRIGRLKERLKKLNSYSSMLNILTLMALTWHLVYLSQRLNMTC